MQREVVQETADRKDNRMHDKVLRGKSNLPTFYPKIIILEMEGIHQNIQTISTFW